MIAMRLTVRDVDVLLDALARAAARHESLAAALKPGSQYAAQHNRKAAAMRDLRFALAKLKAANRPMTMEIA